MKVISMGKRIEGARLAAGYDEAAAFARAAGLTKQYMFNLEHGVVTKPDPHKLLKVAQRLNVALEWILTGAGGPGRVAAGTPSHTELLRNFDRLAGDQQADVLHFVRGMLNDARLGR